MISSNTEYFAAGLTDSSQATLEPPCETACEPSPVRPDPESESGQRTDIRTIFSKKLLSLGELTRDPGFEGIWVPEDLTESEIDSCIHTLFREKAQEYVRAYQKTHHFECLLRTAFEKSGFKRFDEPLRILDICSGAGNSVIPLLSIFPRAEVIASDLSVELLAMLEQIARLARHG